jgi:pimeloyl-ACP methyl ester carboxylesterase/DNA-binding winged helix-turn-helix (wHTH) protein
MESWVLDLEDCSLSSGQHMGKLSPKATEILSFLISCNGSVVSRNDILEEIWKGRHTNPDLVREYVFEIRNALGDSAKDPRYIETVGRRGFRIIGPIVIKDKQAPSERDIASELKNVDVNRVGAIHRHQVKICPSKDGASIAHAVSGKGYPLLFAGSWMTHLEMDWESPAYGDYIRHLSDRFEVIRYDQRGNGLSQWSDVDISFERMVDDMEVVVDEYDYDQVAILGMSQGASVAIAYALRQPSRVSHLVLNGGYARGRKQRGDDASYEESKALVSLIRNSWANENPSTRQILTTLLMPEASQEQVKWFNNFQKLCGPAENIAKFRALFDDINVTDILPKVSVPTLVLHSNRDSVAPLSEGILLASNIKQASFVQLNSPNHMLFETEPDFPKMIQSIQSFVSV